jgi:dihydropyrimidinase
VPELATVIRGPSLATGEGRRHADIGIGDDGRIAALGAPGSLSAPRVVDAAGLTAVPGGVDLHVHIATFFGGTTTRDDFHSGTAAALFGGTTTIAQFAIPRPGETSAQAVARTRDEARPDAVSDYAIHGCVVRESYEASLDELGALAANGVGTVKIFSAYTDQIGLSLDRIGRLLARAADAGITVFVHAETDELVRDGIRDAVAAGQTGPMGHARSRTPHAEEDAIRAIADLAAAAGASAYFVHVSSAPSVATLAERRARGERLFAETCPHYLFLDEAVYRQPDGQRWICSPPIRSAEHRDALWDGLRSGVVDAVSSDHNCFDLGQKGPRGSDFRDVPNGLPGVEHRLPLLVSAAIEGRLTWERMVQVSAETPARILGLWPRKGALAVGSDADVVLVDEAGTTELGPGHMASDYSPYAGMRVRGRIQAVWRRGEPVVTDGALRAERGSGEWLPVRAGAMGWRGPATAGASTGAGTDAA